MIILRKSSCGLDITGGTQYISNNAIKTDQAHGRIGDMATQVRGNKSSSNTNKQEKWYDIGAA